MRAIITDIRAGKAAALAEDGTVRLVDAKNRAVGQEIRIPAKHRRRYGPMPSADESSAALS